MVARYWVVEVVCGELRVDWREASPRFATFEQACKWHNRIEPHWRGLYRVVEIEVEEVVEEGAVL